MDTSDVHHVVNRGEKAENSDGFEEPVPHNPYEDPYIKMACESFPRLR